MLDFCLAAWPVIVLVLVALLVALYFFQPRVEDAPIDGVKVVCPNCKAQLQLPKELFELSKQEEGLALECATCSQARWDFPAPADNCFLCGNRIYGTVQFEAVCSVCGQEQRCKIKGDPRLPDQDSIPELLSRIRLCDPSDQEECVSVVETLCTEHSDSIPAYQSQVLGILGWHRKAERIAREIVRLMVVAAGDDEDLRELFAEHYQLLDRGHHDDPVIDFLVESIVLAISSQRDNLSSRALWRFFREIRIQKQHRLYREYLRARQHATKLILRKGGRDWSQKTRGFIFRCRDCSTLLFEPERGDETSCPFCETQQEVPTLPQVGRRLPGLSGENVSISVRGGIRVSVQDQRIQITDLKGNKPRAEARLEQPVGGFTVSPDGHMLACTLVGRGGMKFMSTNGEELHTIKQYSSDVERGTFHPLGYYWCNFRHSVNVDGSYSDLEFWHLGTFKRVKRISKSISATGVPWWTGLTGAGWTPDGSRLIVACNGVAVLDAESWETVARFKTPIQPPFAFHPTRPLLLCRSCKEEDQLFLFDFERGAVTWRLALDGAYDFLGGGERFVNWTPRRISVIETQNGEEVFRETRENEVKIVAPVPGTEEFYVGDEEQIVRLAAPAF